MDDVQVFEGTKTVHYISNNLSELLKTAGEDCVGKEIYGAQLFVQTGLRHTETHEHPWELVLTDQIP